MVIVDVQRAGPSTGMPTKTEQTDLLLAMFGRHGESPLPVVAASSPSDCFDAAFEAVRLAVKYRTPTILLTDGYLANGAEPWLLPDVASLPDISVPFATEPNHDDGFWPYLRDPSTLARPWAIPGTPGLMHRIGGIEKEDGSGNISYQPENHERMVRLRQAKVDGIAADIGGVELDEQEGADLLVIGWGSTWAAITAGVRRVRTAGGRVSRVHLRHLNPFPADLGDVVARHPKVLCPEVNLGQLAMLLRARYLVDVQSYTKVQGVPFRVAEMEARILEEMNR
jgi:2-oxoglutarate ferredoxin oxidoreductase subunit alpha